ncbi:MAG: DUF456 domain-containing protein [Bacteroidales bacterium]|nr:DUF456 domain-containing protein [Bacteroidales bacterium]
MTIFLLILSVACVVIGVLGCVIPVLPGPPLSYVGLLLLHFSDKYEVNTTTLLVLLVLVIIVSLLDYLIPMWGSKYCGASKWGTRGSLIGTFIGLFFMPLGIILGPFLGALIGEKIGGSNTGKAVKSGFGTLLGLLAGIVFKCALCGYITWVFIETLIVGA